MNIPEVIQNDNFWSDIDKQRRFGKISHDQVKDMVRELHKPQFQNMLKLWMEGNLFYSQKSDFDSWLGMDEHMDYKELTIAQEYLSFETGCSEEPNMDIHVFMARRIFKYGHSKKQHILSENMVKDGLRENWRFENKKFNWDWRK